jgi:hypothetical protein
MTGVEASCTLMLGMSGPSSGRQMAGIDGASGTTMLGMDGSSASGRCIVGTIGAELMASDSDGIGLGSGLIMSLLGRGESVTLITGRTMS